MDEMMAELKEAKAALAAARDEAKEARGREEAAVAQERADREALMEAARALGQAQARANVSQQVRASGLVPGSTSPTEETKSVHEGEKTCRRGLPAACRRPILGSRSVCVQTRGMRRRADSDG